MSLAAHWVDGHQAEALPLPDRGLDFGDGLFETFLYARGRVFYPQRHFQRLQRGLEVLGFPDCLETAQNQLDSVLHQLPQMTIEQGALRLTVTRGSGPRGYAPPAQCRPRIIISVTPTEQDWHRQSAPAQLAVAATRWSLQPQLAGIKHLNRLEQVLAARERLAAGADELVMIDGNERVVSLISGNIFAVVKGVIITPSLQACGIRGTRRALIIDTWAPALGMSLQEADIDLAQLEQADELFYSNSVLGLRPVGGLGKRQWSSHPVCEALHDLYCGENQ